MFVEIKGKDQVLGDDLYNINRMATEFIDCEAVCFSCDKRAKKLIKPPFTHSSRVLSSFLVIDREGVSLLTFISRGPPADNGFRTCIVELNQ